MEKADLILDKLNSMDEKFSSMEAKFSIMEEKVSSMDEKFNIMVEKVSGMEAKFSSMDNKVSSLDKKVSSMEVEMKQGFEIVHQKMDMMDERQSELNLMVSAIRDNQLVQRAEHDSLVHEVVNIKGEIVSVHEKLDSFEKSQDRQEKILESLSLRSLEQETDIRELKRIK